MGPTAVTIEIPAWPRSIQIELRSCVLVVEKGPDAGKRFGPLGKLTVTATGVLLRADGKRCMVGGITAEAIAKLDHPGRRAGWAFQEPAERDAQQVRAQGRQLTRRIAP